MQSYVVVVVDALPHSELHHLLRQLGSQLELCASSVGTMPTHSLKSKQTETSSQFLAAFVVVVLVRMALVVWCVFDHDVMFSANFVYY